MLRDSNWDKFLYTTELFSYGNLLSFWSLLLYPYAGEVANVLGKCVCIMKKKWEEIGCNLQDSFLEDSLMECMQILFWCD